MGTECASEPSELNLVNVKNNDLDDQVFNLKIYIYSEAYFQKNSFIFLRQHKLLEYSNERLAAVVIAESVT